MAENENLSEEEKQVQADAEAQKAEQDRLATEQAEKDNAAAAKAEEDRNAQEAAQKLKDQAAAQAGQLTEEQWQTAEKNSGLTRQQLTAIHIITQANIMNSPQTKLVERDVFDVAKNSYSKDLQATVEQARAEIEKLSAQERMSAARVKEKIDAFIGRRLAEGKLARPAGGGGAARMGTGTQDGATTDIDSHTTGDTAGMTPDEKEVAQRFGFKNKAEMDKASGKEISLEDEQNFVPKWH